MINIFSVFRDLLATTATSSKLLIEITFNDDDGFERLEQFFIDKMQLYKVGKKIQNEV